MVAEYWGLTVTRRACSFCNVSAFAVCHILVSVTSGASGAFISFVYLCVCLFISFIYLCVCLFICLFIYLFKGPQLKIRKKVLSFIFVE